MKRIQRAALTVALVFSVSAPSQAQLPTVQQVFDKYATAVGGRDAWAKVTDRAEKGTAEIVFAGLSGSYERYYAAPGKMRLIIDLGMGKVEQGSDGRIVWSGQPDGSKSRMADPEATYAIEANAIGAAFLDPSRLAKATVASEEEFDGVPCYKLVVTTRAGRERIDYFEVASGLRRGQVVQTAAGPQKTTFRDYKTFDGKMVSTKQVLTNPQGDIIISVASVTFAPSDPTLFDVPAGIAK
jgi:outer membrane lipoprotein-sorting protein